METTIHLPLDPMVIDVVGLDKAAGSKGNLQTIVNAIAKATADIAAYLSRGRFAIKKMDPSERDASLRIEINAETDPADMALAMLVDSLRGCGVRDIICAGHEECIVLDDEGCYAVAVDPLDGASNIDTNMPLGTIFSVSFAGDATTDRSGTMQLAAGFVVYGPQTSLVLTSGDGVDIYLFEREAKTFRLARSRIAVPSTTAEYAIDASNYRNWPSAVRGLIDDYLENVDEPGAQTFNMRWMGSLVAEAYRILARGGVFMCPFDKRRGAETGCQRLLTAAHPIGFVMEQAGAVATTGYSRILDRATKRLDEQTPFIFGSRETVERIERLHALPEGFSETAPLFRRQGLFRI